MRSSSAAVALLAMILATPAVAGSSGRLSDQAEGGRLIASLDALGYDAKILHRDHSAFRVQMVDRQSGGLVRAVFDADSGELLEAALDDQP